MNKEHLYKGYKIKNIPLNSKARWFVFDNNDKRVTLALSSLKRCKDYVDGLVINNSKQ